MVPFFYFNIMVNFNDLRITPDGENLFINTSVAPYKYFENMHIATIAIYNEDTVSFASGGSGISGTPLFSQDISELQSKEYSWNLSAKDLKTTDVILDNLSGHIFYIVITVDGIPSPDTPCSMDKNYSIGVVLNWQPIYQQGINNMKMVVDNCCEISKNFIDYILRFKAFELALRTAQYKLANDKFKQWFKESEQSYVLPCGCK